VVVDVSLFIHASASTLSLLFSLLWPRAGKTYSALRAVVAVNGVSRVTLVGVVLEVVTTLGDLQAVLGDDLVEGVGAAGEDLAGVAVTQDVAAGVLVEGGGPFGGAAVAGSVVGRHVCVCGLCG
jgi:hypothetical protein